MKTYLSTLPRFSGIVGIGFFLSCLFHIFFFSRVHLHYDYFPIQDSYSYPNLIWISLLCAAFLVLDFKSIKSNKWLFSSRIWFINFLMVFALKLGGWPLGENRVILYGVFLIWLIHTLIYFVSSKRKIFAPLKFFIKFIPSLVYASLFLIFVCTSRFYQLLIARSAYPLNNSYFKLFDKSNSNHPCKISDNSLLANRNSKILLLILDGYPISSMYEKLTGSQSGLHTYLRQRAISYFETNTSIPYTPYSLAYLLAGDNLKSPDVQCTYPRFNKLHPFRLAFNSLYFQGVDNICNSSFSFEEKFVNLISNPTQVYDKNLAKKIIYDHSKICSLANPEIVDDLMPWMTSRAHPEGTRLNPKIDVIHDFFFHDNNKKYNLYPNIDAEYRSTIQKLISKLLDRPDPLYDQIIIMSDHGPRTEKFGTLNSGDKLLSSSLKFNDYYKIFIAIFTNSNQPPVWSPDYLEKIDYYNPSKENMYPERVFVD